MTGAAMGAGAGLCGSTYLCPGNRDKADDIFLSGFGVIGGGVLGAVAGGALCTVISNPIGVSAGVGLAYAGYIGTKTYIERKN